MKFDFRRASILITRITGVLGGLLFLLAAALFYANTGMVHWELVGVGIVFPVGLLWMARVLARHRDDA
jgi:tetrahydromethanopterin S-methyltransferase subunit D